jgi:predicted Rossmann-fold nucleotide-binding protein
LNVDGYYKSLIHFLDYTVEQNFVKPKDRALLIVEQEPNTLLARFEAVIATHAAKRFDRSQT